MAQLEDCSSRDLRDPIGLLHPGPDESRMAHRSIALLSPDLGSGSTAWEAAAVDGRRMVEEVFDTK